MVSSSTEGQRLDATVTHTLWRQSRQVFVESYRILHDQLPEDAIFEGETLIRTLAIEDQPRLGPIRVFRRRLNSQIAPDDAVTYFAGNTSPYVTQYDPALGAPLKPAVETVADRESSGARSEVDGIQRAMQFQRQSYEAPGTIDDDDVLWDLDNLRDWYGVRYLHVEREGINEVLDVVSLDHAHAVRSDRCWEILDALEVSHDSLLALEYQQAVVHLNNRNLFQVRRRSRLTDTKYIAEYADV